VYPQFSEYDTEVLYQAEPILRVVFPGSVASAKLHKDSEFWHQCNEVNYWVPLTDVKGENSLWSESVPGKGEDVCVSVCVCVCVWSGGRL
jgi:hypothetical protein